jgi:WD40 repeat protein
VAVTADGHRAVSTSYDGTLRLWDLGTGQVIRTFKGETGWVYNLAVMPDGRSAVSASDYNTLRVWDLESGQTVRTLRGHTNSVEAVAVTPDGRCAVSASNDRTLRVWDLESGKEVATFTGDDHMGSCAIAPDGRTIVAGDRSGRMHFLGLVEADKTKPLQSAK